MVHEHYEFKHDMVADVGPDHYAISGKLYVTLLGCVWVMCV
jgi:hypothetical protein